MFGLCVIDATPAASTWSERAEQSLGRFVSQYWSHKQHYLLKYHPDPGSLTLSEYWNYAQSFDAVIDGVLIAPSSSGPPVFGEVKAVVEAMYAGQAARGWSRAYYDDMNWMAIALLRAFHFVVPSQRAFVQTAETLYGSIMAAWDTTCCGSNPGGIWWDTAHTQKATASNAGPVITGVYLHALTGNATYLTFAERVYDYWWRTMVNTTTYQVADHIEASSGDVVWWKYTYNEGLMVGASVALHCATANATYLDNAHAVAGFMYTNETVRLANSTHSLVLTDGDANSCTGTDCPQFKGIAFRYLNMLQRVSPRAHYAQLLADSANAIWTLAQQNGTTLFGTAWQGPPPQPNDVINNAQESAAAMAIAIYARQVRHSLNDQATCSLDQIM